MPFDIGVWDILLLLLVPAQVTCIAYVRSARWKALLWNLPIPFTFATLAVGKPLAATNVLGLLMLLGFVHAVRLLYTRLKVNIIVSIALLAVAYCVIAAALVPVIPTTPEAFWIAFSAVFALGLILHLTIPHRDEPGDRSDVPVWIKFPTIVLVIAALLAIKGNLQGFMTMFPMAGVVTLYETRRCLWTISRQVPLIMMTFLAMQGVCYLFTDTIGLGPALMFGWVAFAALLIPMTLRMWGTAGKQ